MQQLFPPCPACGSTRAFFPAARNHSASIRVSVSDSLSDKGVALGALICLTCGHTELRPHPYDMQRLRESVETRGLLPPLRLPPWATLRCNLERVRAC